MGKIKKGLIIFGIIFVIWVIAINVLNEPEPEVQQQVTKPYETKMTPEEIAEWDAQIQKDRDEWRQKMEEGINQQRELEKEINAWKEKMDDTFVADVNPKISEGEWYYTKNCTEMSMAWGLMPDVLWTELEVKRAIEACIQDAKINDPDAFLP